MNLVITMSRRFGTGASLIARELSEKLGIPVYDKAHIEQELHDNNTGKVWGDVNNYHMIMDTSQLGIQNCAGILIKYFERVEII